MDLRPFVVLVVVASGCSSRSELRDDVPDIGLDAAKEADTAPTEPDTCETHPERCEFLDDGAFGDGLRYRYCTRAMDCPDPARPFCTLHGVALGGDSTCNGVVRICRAEATDDCDTRCPVEPPAVGTPCVAARLLCPWGSCLFGTRRWMFCAPLDRTWTLTRDDCRGAS